MLLSAAVALAVAAPALVADRTAQRTDAMVREAASALDAAQRGVRVTTSSADDAAAQLSEADAVLGALLDDVPVLTARLTYPLEARSAGGAGPTRSMVLAHVTDWASHVGIVDGRAPGAGAAEVVAPRASGLAAGTRLLVGSAGLPVEVVGTWQPLDPSDPLWFADPGLASGTMSGLKGAIGPLLAADAAVVNRAAPRPLVRWTVVPQVEGLTADQLTALAERLESVPDALAGAGLLVQGASIDAEGGANLAVIAGTASAARLDARVAVGVAVAAGLAGLWAAVGLVEARTRRERTLLRARGARPGPLVSREAPWVLGAAALGALLGWAAGGAAGAPVWWAVAAGLGGGAAALVPAATRLPVDRSGPPPGVTAAVGASVLVPATALAVWQLGRAPAGAVATVAPALVLVCAGLLGALVTPLVARALVPPARGARGLVPLLSARRMSRHLGAVPVLAALTAGAATYATRSADGVGTAWSAAAVATALVGVVALVSDVMTRSEERRADDVRLRGLTAGRAGAAARRVARAASVLVAAGAGVAAAVVIAALVPGVAS